METIIRQDDMKVEAEGTVTSPDGLADRYVELLRLARDVVNSDRVHPEHDCAPFWMLATWLEANP